MTYEFFVVLLVAYSVITSLFVEAVKKALDTSKVAYASNVLVLCIAVLVGGFGTVFFYVCNDIAFTLKNIIAILMMVCANWLVAMVGYDKVMQAITQLKGGKSIE